MAHRLVYLETFGCQMNELDSELVTGQLRALGYQFTPTPDAADVVLYNTCSVREHAEQKVWSRLGIDRLRKQRQPHVVVGVLGCMAERDGLDLLKRMPVVDVLCGPGELDKLPALLDNAVRTRAAMLDAAPIAPEVPGDALSRAAGVSAAQVALQGNTSRRSATLAAAEDTLELLDLSRAVSPTDHHGSAYVRITRGCNKFCTYCVVPFTRGAEVHRPPDHIVDECRRLADAGVIEVTLLGQTVNHYRFEHGHAVTAHGVVQPQKGRTYRGATGRNGSRRDAFEGERVTTFAGLLRRIHDEVPAIRRLRFVTSFPRDFGDDVLQVIRESPRICRYLHVPAQSGSDRILAQMNRGYTAAEYLAFLDRARAFLHQPEIGRPLTIAGDIIVGFPGETDADFAATESLLERARYKNCYIFKYSPRPGTPAFDRLADDVPDQVKRARNSRLLALQQRISDEVGQDFVGRRLEVFVEGISPRERKRRRAAPDARRETAHSGVPLTVGGRTFAPDPPPAMSVDDATDEPLQLTARTEGDVIVHFTPPAGRTAASLVGGIVPVMIHEGRGLALSGTMVE